MKICWFFLQIHLLKSAENIQKNRFSVRKSCQNFISVKLSYSKTCMVAILAVFSEKKMPRILYECSCTGALRSDLKRSFPSMIIQNQNVFLIMKNLFLTSPRKCFFFELVTLFFYKLAANASGRRGMVSRACWDLGVSDVIASYTYFSGVEIMTGKCQLFKTVMYFLTYYYYIMFFWLLLVRESLIWQLVSFIRLERML